MSKLEDKTGSRAKAFERYDQLTDLPLLLLAVAILPLLVVPLLLDFSPAIDRAFLATDWIIWAAFAVDLGIRVYLTDKRREYLIRHWYDVVIVAVPFLRPLRIFRSARALRLLRLSRLTGFAARIIETIRDLGRRHGLAYVLVLAIFVLLVASSLMFAFERESGGPIDSFGAALWWGATTITTVGYGDAFPITPEGRGIAVVLMIVGISLFGFLTANIAAFLVEQGQESSVTTLDNVMAKLDSLETELRTLRQEMSQR